MKFETALYTAAFALLAFFSAPEAEEAAAAPIVNVEAPERTQLQPTELDKEGAVLPRQALGEYAPI